MRKRSLTLNLFAALAMSPAHAANPDSADQIVQQANLAAYYAGDDGRSDARMTIVDAQGRKQIRQFTLIRRDQADGGDQNFMVFFSRPADVRGTTFLVGKNVTKDDDRWLYLPGLDLVKRISAGDKRTSFVGSDYFYEDVSGRNPSEDHHQLLHTTDTHYIVKNTPIDGSQVEFASYQVWIDKNTLLPMTIEYHDDNGKPYRKIEVLETRRVDGFPTVTKSKVSNLVSGGYTLMEFRNTAYNIGLPEQVFSERSLRQPPRQWLKRR